jgi:FeS assembly SUF system regulator
MIKLSKLTDYAVVVLAVMAQDNGRLMTASVLSEKTTLPEPTVAKVLKLLAKGGVVMSTRGASGGYQLTNLPAEISIARVVIALEGPVELAACVEGGEGCCAHSHVCTIKGKWNPINLAMKNALEQVTLAQMIEARE